METLLTSGEKLHLFHDLIPPPTPPPHPPYTHTSTLAFPMYSYFLPNFPMTSWAVPLDRNILPASEHALFFMILLTYKLR